MNGANIMNGNYDKAASSTTVAQSTISACEVLPMDESKAMPKPTSYALGGACNASNSEAFRHRAVTKKPVIGLSTTSKLKTISVKHSVNLFILRLEPNT